MARMAEVGRRGLSRSIPKRRRSAYRPEGGGGGMRRGLFPHTAHRWPHSRPEGRPKPSPPFSFHALIIPRRRQSGKGGECEAEGGGGGEWTLIGRGWSSRAWSVSTGRDGHRRRPPAPQIQNGYKVPPDRSFPSFNSFNSFKASLNFSSRFACSASNLTSRVVKSSFRFNNLSFCAFK